MEKEFTPALGDSRLTPLYDIAIRLLTRERVWREKLIEQIDPLPNDRILDVGCGTGSLALRMKAYQPNATIIGLDPDEEVLTRARSKARSNNTQIEWHHGFLDQETVQKLMPVTKVVSSLVLHQTPLREKADLLSAMFRVLEPNGSLHIADYGLQRSKLMRVLFRRTVQMIDGRADTQPNADGVLPELIEAAGFSEVQETRVIKTATGSISLYSAVKRNNREK